MPETELQTPPLTETPPQDQSQTKTPPQTETQKTSEEPPKSSGPPAEYTPFTAPEGVTFDEAAIKSATTVFRELGLNQAQAQRLIDFQTNRDKSWNNKSAETYDRMRSDWRKQVEAHPTLGGAKLEETRAEISKAIETFPKELGNKFKEALNLTGAGDHPAVVEVFHTLARLANEGQHVSGSGPSPEGQRAPGTTTRPSQASAMFPELPSATARQPVAP